MVEWVNNLRVTEKIKNKKKIMTSINKGRIVIDIYCIAFSINRENLFDIYNVNELKFPYYKNKKITVVGLAKGKEDAITLTQEILLEIYNNTGDFKVREYFNSEEVPL